MIFLLLFLILILPVDAAAAPHGQFKCLKNNETNMRVGPGMRFPIKWVYKRKNLPMQKIDEYDIWVKLRDFEGAEGWVHTALVKNRKCAIVTEIEEIFKSPEPGAKLMAQISARTPVMVEECNISHCLISVSDVEGWIRKKSLWGVMPSND